MEFCIQVRFIFDDILNFFYLGYKKDVWIAINPDTGVHRETAQPQNINSCPVENHPGIENF